MRFILFLLVFLILALALGYYLAPKLPGYGQVCGGIVGETEAAACPAGFTCKYPTPNHGDEPGVCKPRFLPDLGF